MKFKKPKTPYKQPSTSAVRTPVNVTVVNYRFHHFLWFHVCPWKGEECSVAEQNHFI